MAEKTYQLLVQKGPAPGKVYTLNKETMVVGRDPVSDIVVEDLEVSRQHARFTLTPAGYQLQDMGSTNGSFVDGERLGGTAVSLSAGQVILFGSNVEMVYQVISDIDPMATVIAPASSRQQAESVPEPEPEPEPEMDAEPEEDALPSFDEFDFEEDDPFAAPAQTEDISTEPEPEVEPEPEPEPVDDAFATVIEPAPPQREPEPEPAEEEEDAFADLPDFSDFDEPAPSTPERDESPSFESTPVPEEPAKTPDLPSFESAGPGSGSPPPPPVVEKTDGGGFFSNRRNVIIVAVVVVLLLCCCLVVAGSLLAANLGYI